MQLERRRAQDVAKCVDTSFRLRTEYMEGTYTDLIASWAKNRGEKPINNLMQFFSIDNLRSAFKQIPGSKAKGYDGITKDEYGKGLENKLQDLHHKMRKMTHKPAPARLVLIPKPNGEKRPIAVSNFEDKLVQKVAADILIAIYEREFKPFSFGFRPKKSCHSAIGYLYSKLKTHSYRWVVDVDLEKFFNSINHKKLIEVLKLRISDKQFLQYITRMLKAGILVEGNCQEAETGTPQGSIVSPVLANIFLHHVMDEWYRDTIQPELGGTIVRYADDIVAAFSTKAKAKWFAKMLEKRLEEFELKINRDKTRITYFYRNSQECETFDFLGFTFYWGKSFRFKSVVLKVKTSTKTLVKKIQNFKDWIKAKRNRHGIATLWKEVSVKLTGHYNYYGVMFNRKKLFYFYSEVIRKTFRWLNRRSQKRSYNWYGFRKRLETLPLPLPPENSRLKLIFDPKLYR